MNYIYKLVAKDNMGEASTINIQKSPTPFEREGRDEWPGGGEVSTNPSWGCWYKRSATLCLQRNSFSIPKVVGRQERACLLWPGDLDWKCDRMVC